MSHSMLERIRRAADPVSNERATWRAEDLESAIVEHLARLLSTRQGGSLTAPDYGVPELSELSNNFPDAVAMAQRALKATLTIYEPRLKNVQVRGTKFDLTEMQFEFEVTGTIQHADGRRTALRIGLGVDSGSKLRIISE
jgi:type VI secretion system protein